MGFKFNGIHSNDMDIVWKTESRPFMPIEKTIIEDTVSTDGIIDFSEINADGRSHYSNRIFTGLITITKCNTLQELHIQLTKIANWLMCGYKNLIFDDMAETVWIAKVENADNVMYLLSKIGKAVLNFNVKPFSKYLLDSNSELLLDSETILDSGIPLDGFDYNYSITGTESITVKNYGDWYTKPIITIEGIYSYVEIKKDDNTKIRYYGESISNDVVVIDFTKCQITKNGVFDNVNSLGNFWEFTPGDNVLTIITDTAAELNFYMEFNFKYGAVIIDD